jgi:hypothetical protein
MAMAVAVAVAVAAMKAVSSARLHVVRGAVNAR